MVIYEPLNCMKLFALFVTRRNHEKNLREYFYPGIMPMSPALSGGNIEIRSSDEKTISDLEGFATSTDFPRSGLQRPSSELSAPSMPTLVSIEESSWTLSPRESDFVAVIPAFLRENPIRQAEVRQHSVRDFFVRLFGCGRKRILF